MKVTDGVVHELALSMEIALSNTDSVELVVDPGVVMATKKDLQVLEVSIREKLEDLTAGLEQLGQSAGQDRERLDSLQEAVEDVEVRLSLLELMYATEINKNPFSVTFGDLEGIVAEGIWNVTEKRLDF